MNRRSGSFSWIAALVVLTAAGVSSAAPAAMAPTMTLMAGGAGLEFRIAGDRGVATLSLARPDGEVVRREFRTAEPVSLSLFDEQGNRLADGVYRWELVVAPSAGSVREAHGVDKRGGTGWVESGSFRVAEGAVVDPLVSEPGAGRSPASPRHSLTLRDQVIADDLIVQGSGCFGFDCVNNESFGFDTIRLKENNLRLKFEDTSVGTFPSNDWQLTANDSASGGQSKFSIEDITGAKVPFTIEAGATTDSVFVDSTGRVGFRTSTPVLDLHVATSNTPALRLEQSSAGGFTAQTWDVAGNEANFFVRDVTSGSRLPFRIAPGAPTNSIYVASTGNVGLGLSSPSSKLHLRATDGSARLRVEEASATAANRVLAQFVNSGPSTLELTNTATSETWRVINRDDLFVLNYTSDGQNDNELALDEAGNLTILGTLTEGSDRNRKRDIAPVDPGHVLERVLALPLATWQFRADTLGGRHLGPMAQDFAALFGLGVDDKTIAPLDVAGVGLAAIQALHAELQQREVEIRTLRDANNELVGRILEIERVLQGLAGR